MLGQQLSVCSGTALRAATAMTYIAIAEMLTAKAVEWMEHVTDEQYGG